MPMSEQTGGTHGPPEDEPEATWAPEGRPGGTPPGESWDTIELRSDLARHLDRTAFPATRERLLEILAAHQAEQRLLDLVSPLPEGATYASLAELLPAPGLPIEHRPS